MGTISVLTINHLSFPIIHKVGNVDNFVLQISKIEKSATLIIFQSTMNNVNLL